MANEKDYYEILGLDRNATENDIKNAYRKLAKEYHPDANPDNKNAEEKFKEIGKAYEVLGDVEKKGTYDQFGHSAYEQSGGSGGGYGGFSEFDASDIFEQFFGGGFSDIFGGGTSSRRQGPKRGTSIQTHIEIEFEEAYRGVTKDVIIDVNDMCDTCKGTGAKPGTNPETCRACNGTGQERVLQQTMFGTMQQIRTCSTCYGTGKIIKEKCNTCNGESIVKKTKTYSLNIPKGIESGQMIRMDGKGNQGEMGQPSGDIIVAIYVKPHKEFIRDGNDLHVSIPISFPIAALGGEIDVPTMDGTEKYVVKAGTQTGIIIRIRNKGMPYLRGNRKGDLLMELNIQTPINLNDKQRETLIAYAKELGEENFDTKKGFFSKVKDMFND